MVNAPPTNSPPSGANNVVFTSLLASILNVGSTNPLEFNLASRNRGTPPVIPVPAEASRRVNVPPIKMLPSGVGVIVLTSTAVEEVTK